MEGDIPLASLSLTHVHYIPGDPISYLCAWLALVPQGLCVTYVVLIWATREIEIVSMFAGQMACEALNFLLKRILKEERPKQMHGKGYGMPSSHSQFLGFFGVYISLFLLFRHRSPAAPSQLQKTFPKFPIPSSTIQHAIVSFLFIILAGLVAISRIYLSYHTPRQVLVGSAAGTIAAFAWFAVTTWLRRSGWIDYFLDTTLAQALRVTDLVVEEDLLDSRWERWERKRPERRAKAVNKTKGKNR